MSGWLDDFRDAYAEHPLCAVGMLAMVILAGLFASVAFAVHFSGGYSYVPPSTAVVQPAQGQTSEPNAAPTLRSAPPKTSPAYTPIHYAYFPVPAKSADPAATLAGTVPASGPASPAMPIAVQTPSARPDPSATPSATPTITATTPTSAPTTPTTTPDTTSPDTSTPSAEAS